mmetsp:Transcript_20582/g.37187  ORF Transcript_20582/g.37187 Transcript_20582/m.37187 type:complete len:84 (-) Transcript_20582:44-295(-)
MRGRAWISFARPILGWVFVSKCLVAFRQFVLWMNLLQKQSVATVRRYHVQSRKLVSQDFCLKDRQLSIWVQLGIFFRAGNGLL